MCILILFNHSSNFVELCLLKMEMSWSREFVRFICFCVVHSVSMYWHTTSPNGSVGVGVEVGYVLSVRVCTSHSRWSIWSNPSACWPSPASNCCHKLCISLTSMFKSTWLLGRRLLRWPSASDPPKAIAVSELSVLSLSAKFLVSSTWELRPLPSPPCPTPI